MKRLSVQKAALLLLGIFLVLAVALTIGSQKNYDNNLVEVAICYPEETSITHTIEWIADYRKEEDGYIVWWEMEEWGSFIEEGDEVTVYSAELTNVNDISGRLIPLYHKNDSYVGMIVQTIYMEERGTYVIQSLIDDSLHDDIEESEILIAEITFSGRSHDYVIPHNCIIQPQQVQDSCMIYVIEDVPKIWGTAKQLKKIPITILETNGKYTAIRNYTDGEVVVNAINMELSPGLDVKINNLE